MSYDVRIDLTGKTFGRLTVIGPSPIRGNAGQLKWTCRCACGNTKDVQGRRLRTGHTTSCGCYMPSRMAELRYKHGEAWKTDEYRIWQGMIRRCELPTVKAYPRYGGRGIFVCHEWRHDYLRFVADMGRRPSKKHSVDRINNDGPYSPDNCRWATAAEQNRNQRPRQRRCQNPSPAPAPTGH